MASKSTVHFLYISTTYVPFCTLYIYFHRAPLKKRDKILPTVNKKDKILSYCAYLGQDFVRLKSASSLVLVRVTAILGLEKYPIE